MNTKGTNESRTAKHHLMEIILWPITTVKSEHKNILLNPRVEATFKMILWSVNDLKRFGIYGRRMTISLCISDHVKLPRKTRKYTPVETDGYLKPKPKPRTVGPQKRHHSEAWKRHHSEAMKANKNKKGCTGKRWKLSGDALKNHFSTAGLHRVYNADGTWNMAK